MTEDDVAIALADWLAEILDESEIGTGNGIANTYSYINAEKGALPDVMADVREKRIGLGGEEPFFPMRQIEQAMMRTFECELSFLVETHDGAAAAENETKLLRLYGATVEEQASYDATLRGHLSDQGFCSPLMVVNYDSPFIQYADGTRGRQMVATLAVGELIEEDPPGMSAQKKYVFRSPVGGKLHAPTEDGVETFEADVPRTAPAKMIEDLRDQGFEIEDAEPEQKDENGDDGEE